VTSIRKLARRLSRALYAYRHGYQHTGERVNPDFADENFKNHLRFYQFASQFVRGKEVLDCGCGTGYGAALLADSGAKAVLGIDFSNDAIKFAERRFVRPNLSFRVMDAEHLLLQDGSVDFVYSSENLEHLNNPEANISEIRRVLRPGGMLVLGTPNKEVFSPGRKPDNPYHVKEFYFEELQSLLSKHFSHVHIFENTLEPKDPLGQQLRRERFERSAIGLRPDGRKTIILDGLSVDLAHLHNTHALVCLCW
jgi:ubiquinone/menaquinone biosynthesis C-methylase UbiE